MAGLFDIVDRNAFLDAVQRQETSTNRIDPNAPMLSPTEAVSPSGAVGVMQIIPEFAVKPGYGAQSIFDVAEGMGFDMPQDMRTEEVAKQLAIDPGVAREYAANYLSAMFDKFGSVDEALAAYNFGPRGYGEIEGAGGAGMPKETREYYPGVRRWYTEATGEAFPVGISPRPQQRPSGLLNQVK